MIDDKKKGKKKKEKGKIFFSIIFSSADSNKIEGKKEKSTQLRQLVVFNSVLSLSRYQPTTSYLKFSFLFFFHIFSVTKQSGGSLTLKVYKISGFHFVNEI